MTQHSISGLFCRKCDARIGMANLCHKCGSIQIEPRKSLTEVTKANARLRTALESRHVAITRAAAEGVSLREIAEAAGVSHETIRRILND